MNEQDKHTLLSRISNAARDKVLLFDKFTKTDERLSRAVEAAKEAGITQEQVTRAVQDAAKGNPKVHQAMINYGKAAEKNESKSM